MKTLVLANQKGGVGKSAIATQLALYVNRQGRSVVVIDLDHQQNTSGPLRANTAVTVSNFTASQLLTGQGVPASATGRLVLVPGDVILSTLERQPTRHNDFAGQLRSAIGAWQHFDVCIIDTNPNPDIRYGSALISADYVLAPIQLNLEAIEGIGALFNHARYGVTRIKATLNPGLVVLGILPNLVEPTPFQRSNLKSLVEKYGSRLLARRDEAGVTYGYIAKRSAIAEAQASGMFLPDLAKTSARDAWREIQPVFDMILTTMDLTPTLERLA